MPSCGNSASAPWADRRRRSVDRTPSAHRLISPWAVLSPLSSPTMSRWPGSVSGVSWRLTTMCGWSGRPGPVGRPSTPSTLSNPTSPSWTSGCPRAGGSRWSGRSGRTPHRWSCSPRPTASTPPRRSRSAPSTTCSNPSAAPASMRSSAGSVPTSRQRTSRPAPTALRTAPPTPRPLVRLGVRMGSRIRLVDVGDVDAFEWELNYVRVHVGSDVYLARATLSALEDKLDPRAVRSGAPLAHRQRQPGGGGRASLPGSTNSAFGEGSGGGAAGPTGSAWSAPFISGPNCRSAGRQARRGRR